GHGSKRRLGRPFWDGSRSEGLLDLAQHERRAPFLHGLEPSELEPRQPDVAFPAKRIEAEVGEEVGREDRPVDEEALVYALPLWITVGERLDRLCPLVARLADGREEEALDRPGRGRVDEVRARDEEGV